MSRTVKHILLGAASGILARLAPSGQLIKQTGASLARFRPETAGHRSVT